MARKWEAMSYLQKMGKISIISLLLVVPSVTFANTVVTSQTYVDMRDDLKVDKYQGDTNSGKVLVVGTDGNVTTAASSSIGDANVIENVQVNGANLTITNKTVNVPVMGAASASAAGTVGVVPASAAGDQNKFLRADATWQDISVSNMTGATETVAGAAGLVPAPAAGDQNKVLHGDGTWEDDQDTTYTFATGETSGAFTVTPEGGSAQTVSVNGWGDKQNKPATAEIAAGKVLTYNSTADANATNNYSAKYIQVPVADNAPNGDSATVSALADIWVE